MKTLVFLVAAWVALHAEARARLLESDPEVVYIRDFTEEKEVKLEVVKEATVYASKKGGQRYGVLQAGTTAELLGFTDRAFRVRGYTVRGKVVGWVSPKAFAAKDPKFLQDYKKIYRREMEVRKLIEEETLAIGMAPDEVFAILGEPTKKRTRITAKGQNGVWEYLKYEEVKHYNQVTDPFTGTVFRQYSHTTQEVKSRLAVEFENGAVTAIEESESKEAAATRKVVIPPLFFRF